MESVFFPELKKQVQTREPAGGSRTATFFVSSSCLAPKPTLDASSEFPSWAHPLVVLKTFPLDIASASFCDPSDSWRKAPLGECYAPYCSAQPQSKTSDRASSEGIPMLFPDFLSCTQARRGLESHLSVMGWWFGCVFMPLT